MSELIFAIRMTGITFLLVIIMQIRVSDITIEEHAHTWIRTATPIVFFREVAEGGLAATHDAWVSMTSGIKTKYWSKFDKKKMPGHRELGLPKERSEAYIEEQKIKAEILAEEQLKKKEKVEAALASRAKKVRDIIGLSNDSEDETESREE